MTGSRRDGGPPALLALAASLVLILLSTPAAAQSAPMAEAARQAVASGVPAPDVEELVRHWQERGHPPSTGASLLQAITGIAREGLPARPLVDKSLEGLSKGVPADAIARVVTQQARFLKEAHAVLSASGVPAGPGAAGRDRALEALAQALLLGAPPDSLRALLQAVAARVSGDHLRWAESTADAVVGLIGGAVSIRDTGELVLLGLDRASSPADLREIPARALALRREGLSPTQVLDRLRQELGRGAPRTGPPPERSPGRPAGPTPPLPPPASPPVRLPTR